MSKNKREKLPKKISDMSPIEELEGKENELDAITRDFLENADPDDIHAREVYQRELQIILEQAKPEEIKYAEALRRVKATQCRDWTKQGCPMKTITEIEEKPVEKKSDSDIKISKMIEKEKKVPATIFSITKKDMEMMELSNDPNKFDKLTEKEKQDFDKWLKEYQSIAISDEQSAEIGKLQNAYEELTNKYSEKSAILIENAVTPAFPEFYLKERPWKKKKPKIEPELEEIKFNAENNYAA